MPKTNTKAGNWDYELRRTIKRKHGKGWTIAGRGKKTRLIQRHADGSYTSVTINIEWTPDNDTAIATEVEARIKQMLGDDIGLKKAHDNLNKVKSVATADGIKTGAVDWQRVAEAYLQTKAGNRSTTRRESKGRVDRALALFAAKSRKINDGASLMNAYASSYFGNCPPGSPGRKRGLAEVAALLSYGVEKCGADARWKPLTGEELDMLIGDKDDQRSSISPPLKPEDLVGLLDHLRDKERHDLWLAVALVGMYGLRPAELGALKVEDGQLKVSSHVKRNAKTKKKEVTYKLVLPLEIDGRDDGAQALAIYAKKGVKALPTGIRTGIESGEFKPIGDSFRQYLDRLPYWQKLVADNEGLTPYAMRHGWAWRAHCYYDKPISVREAAALMRHDPNTHNRHYGIWTNEADLLSMVSTLKPKSS